MENEYRILLERIAVALEKIAGIGVPLAPASAADTVKQSRPPNHATAEMLVGLKGTRCKDCQAGIYWVQTRNGWRPYDDISPWPMHYCTKRREQDTADLLPGRVAN
jgi:hypothetical protein